MLGPYLATQTMTREQMIDEAVRTVRGKEIWHLLSDNILEVRSPPKYFPLLYETDAAAERIKEEFNHILHRETVRS